MPKLRVQCFGVSLDGYSAGPNQSLENPLGEGGTSIMEWFFPTQVFRQMNGQGDGETGVDNDFAVRGFENIGAWILGRNMFGPIRGPWPNNDWKGWWGVRVDSPRSRPDCNGRRHDVPFRHRRNRKRAGTSEGCRTRKGRSSGWRRSNRPPIPPRWLDRRTAFGPIARAAGFR